MHIYIYILAFNSHLKNIINQNSILRRLSSLELPNGIKIGSQVAIKKKVHNRFNAAIQYTCKVDCYASMASRAPVYEDQEFFGVVESFLTFIYNNQQSMLALIKPTSSIYSERIQNSHIDACQYFNSTEWQNQEFIIIDVLQIRKMVAFWNRKDSTERSKIYILDMNIN